MPQTDDMRVQAFLAPETDDDGSLFICEWGTPHAHYGIIRFDGEHWLHEKYLADNPDTAIGLLREMGMKIIWPH